jgi:PleD family two-component response regulator
VVVFHSPPASAEEAIRRADTLMYKVKSTGKNDLIFEEVVVESGGYSAA